MKTELRNLLTRGYSLAVKRKIIKDALRYGVQYAATLHSSTPSTVNRLLAYEKEIIAAKQNDLKVGKKRIRNEQYKLNYKLKHHPSVKRKKHPFKVIANYANSNYKLVCYRNHIDFLESDKLTAANLWDIAKKQKCLCALSGLKLDAETISVDHIIHVSKGGKNTPENVRLVNGKINRMRNDMIDEEFINLCHAVSKWWTCSDSNRERTL